MREILFKAKRIDNGEWVEGLLTIMWGEYHIIHKNNENLAYPIIEETICQYTGLTDKNGNKIWENDICSTDLQRPYSIVVFRNGCFMYGLNDGGEDYFDIMMPTEPLVTCDKYTEVIGNIFDNPELLKGGGVNE